MKAPKLDKDHFLLTELPYHGAPKALYERVNNLLSVCHEMKRDFEDRRRTKTDRIMESWAMYLNSEEALMWLRNRSLVSQGDVNNDWRHRIQTGLAFRTVETIVAYLMGATFPNDDWFDITPMEFIEDEDYLMYLRVMKSYLKTKFRQVGVREKMESFMRQLVIAGTSAFALPWRFETRKTKRNVRTRVFDEEVIEVVDVEKTIYNAPDLQVMNILDFWLDPDADDPNNADFIRRVVMTRAELHRLVKDKYYDLADPDMLKTARPTRDVAMFREKQDIDLFLGITDNAYKPNERVEVYEFWGNIELDDIALNDVVITWTGDTLLRVETNPYWSGRPFVFGSYVPVFDTPYGIGAIEPIRGAIQEQTSIKNQRLDAGELSLAPMYEVINDGTFDVEGFSITPGGLVPVTSLGQTIRPLPFDRGFQTPSIQEEQLLVSDIEQTTATGSYIGTAPGRSGERVTAAEINAARDAGGTRLSSVHRHFEDQVLSRFLDKFYGLCQQFQIEDEVVPVPGDNSDEIWYARVGLESLHYTLYFTPQGAGHIANSEYDLRNMLDWVNAVNSTPEMAKNVNWNEVTKELTRRFIGKNIERYLAKQENPEAPNPDEVPPEMTVPSPEEELLAGLQQAGGQTMADAFAAREMAAPGMTAAALGAIAPSAPLPPGVDPAAFSQVPTDLPPE